MKTLFKIGLILMLTTIFGFQKGLTQTPTHIDIFGKGGYYIYDRYYANDSYNVYAYIETCEGNIYPCSPYNPFATVSQGISFTPGSYLYFPNVLVPIISTPYPYRVVIIANRIQHPQSRTGVSDWANQYGFMPWSPSPIKVQEFGQ